MPVYKSDEINALLKEQKELILDCLAGWILTHFKTKEERNAFLARMHKSRVGPKEVYKQQADNFIQDLRKRILKIWEFNKV